MAFYEFIIKSFGDWVSNPVPSIIALCLGGAFGFWISRMRHQGTIETLQQRLLHRDEQISVKDKAIEQLSQNANALKEQLTSPTPSQSAAIAAPPDPQPSPDRQRSDRFARLNAEIVKRAEVKILEAVTSHRYKFVFNPGAGQWKFLTFLPDKTIGEGRNANENRWQIRAGQLEIINSKHEVYSRFNLQTDGCSFHHTNEPGLPSIIGQYITPV